MKKIKNEDMKKVRGGFSSSMLNAIMRTASFMYNIGQAIGSAIRRTTTRNYC